MLICVNLYIFITNFVFSLTFSVACRLPGPSGVDCCGTHMGWSRVGGWWRGNGGDSGAESGNGWRIPGTGIGELGCGKRGAGNGNPGIADFRNSRNSETGNGFGIDGCAQLCTRERNSAEFTPGNPPETTPETPRKPPN